ncbi:hypothetical protein HOS76_gp46 [Pseudomonas phage Henninger]|uniref:Uncharacterized protein n=1 Tax=Pseudomonas phage Henninger TaxID=2079287 RepID=A0A2K9VHE6_9CAUD|nr:hypothetical protein HOS76_gp46 [Pseudomonas phage Henninger]AUV61740.1 hypothetical protein PsPhHenninger_gp07 [Pseudomonas phage Henninger]
MCFKSKVKTPKTDPDALKAPEPVLIDEPKGVDFGASEDDQSTDSGVDGLTVKKSDVSDKGDGSSSATATDTGYSSTKKTPTATVKRAIKKVTK